MHFDDITLIPAPFSSIESRKDVFPGQEVAGTFLSVPVIASNMDTVYSPELSQETLKLGGMSVVHRFCDIASNVALFRSGCIEVNGELRKPWVSVGVSDKEFDRAQALVEAGAEVIVLDVANAASSQAVRQFRRLKGVFKTKFVVGNFATKEQIEAFNEAAGFRADAYKIGIGSGSICATEDTVTGVGLKHVDTILSCVASGFPVIMDGGVAKPSDFCKSLALGCVGVMMGRPFAATFESAAQKTENGLNAIYRGSADAKSYQIQGKTASYRPPEGREVVLPITGSVQDVVQYYEASLRSSMTYLNARTLTEYRAHAQWKQK